MPPAGVCSELLDWCFGTGSITSQAGLAQLHTYLNALEFPSLRAFSSQLRKSLDIDDKDKVGVWLGRVDLLANVEFVQKLTDADLRVYRRLATMDVGKVRQTLAEDFSKFYALAKVHEAASTPGVVLEVGLDTLISADLLEAKPSTLAMYPSFDPQHRIVHQLVVELVQLHITHRMIRRPMPTVIAFDASPLEIIDEGDLTRILTTTVRRTCAAFQLANSIKANLESSTPALVGDKLASTSNEQLSRWLEDYALSTVGVVHGLDIRDRSTIYSQCCGLISLGVGTPILQKKFIAIRFVQIPRDEVEKAGDDLAIPVESEDELPGESELGSSASVFHSHRALAPGATTKERALYWIARHKEEQRRKQDNKKRTTKSKISQTNLRQQSLAKRQAPLPTSNEDGMSGSLENEGEDQDPVLQPPKRVRVTTTIPENSKQDQAPGPNFNSASPAASQEEDELDPMDLEDSADSNDSSDSERERGSSEIIS